MARPRAGAGARPVTGTAAAKAFCVGCGQPAADCPGCARPLDPPRFCPACGHRMTVAVSPGGYRATCRTHGVITID